MLLDSPVSLCMVRTERLELSHLAAPEPKSGVSTNSTTSASCSRITLINSIIFSKYGVDDGSRTHDTGNHNPVLYQLSYAHHIACCILHESFLTYQLRLMARPAGFEPATTRLEGGCSIRLSYGRLLSSLIKYLTLSSNTAQLYLFSFRISFRLYWVSGVNIREFPRTCQLLF